MSNEENAGSKKGGQLVAIITMFALYAMVGFVTFLAAPAGDVWKYKLPGGSNVLGMLGNSMNFIAYLIMGYPAGKFLQKIGYKKTALLATGSGAVGVLVQVLSGKLEASMGMIGQVPAAWLVYLAGALVSGFSNCLLNTVINPMLNQIVGGGNKGNQLNLGGSAFNSFCGASAPIILGSIIGKITKDTQFADISGVLMAAAAVFIVATLIISFIPIQNPTARKSDVVLERSALAFRHCRFGVIGIFLYMGVELGTQNYMRLWLQPDNPTSPLLKIAGITPEQAMVIAASTAATFMMLMLVGRLVGAIIGGKVSSRTMCLWCTGSGTLLCTVGALCGAFAPDMMVRLPLFQSLKSLAMTQVPLAALFFILAGLSASVMWGVMFNLATEGLGKYTEQASGLFMVMVVGGAILPSLQGWLADSFGFMVSYVVPIFCFAYLFVYALAFSKNVNTDIKID